MNWLSEILLPVFRLPLVRLVVGQSFMNNEVTSSLGYLFPLWPACFQPTSAVLPRRRPPVILRNPGSSSHQLYFLFRDVTFSNLLNDLAVAERLPWGPAPLRDISRESPHSTGFPVPIFVPSSAFLTLPTVYSSLNFVGLFHPTATYGIHLPGVFPAAQPIHLSMRRTLMSFCDSLLPPSCPDCAGLRSPAYRVLIRTAIRSYQQGV